MPKSSLLLKNLRAYVDMIETIWMSADTSAATVTKLGTCFFEDGRAGKTGAGVEVISNGNDTKLIGATSNRCCGIE